MASTPRGYKFSSTSHHGESPSSYRRPRLLRSTATEPSVSPSHAIRGSLVSPSSSPERASDLLSKVAVYSPASSSMGHAASDLSRRDVNSMMRNRDSDASTADSQEVATTLSDSPSSACYFSFPSLDEDKQENRDTFD